MGEALLFITRMLIKHQSIFRNNTRIANRANVSKVHLEQFSFESNFCVNPEINSNFVLHYYPKIISKVEPYFEGSPIVASV